MENCIICKEFVEGRYEVEIRDRNVDTLVKGSVCRFCYNKFVDSFHNTGFFNVAKMVNWIKRKDPLRVI